MAAEPQRTLLGAALDFRQAIVRRDDATLARLAASWRAASADLEAEARRVFAKIAEARLAGQPVSAAWLYRERRAALLLEQIADTLDAYAADAAALILDEAMVAARAAASDALDLARAAGADLDDRTWAWWSRSAAEQAAANAQSVVPQLLAAAGDAARVAAEDALIRAVVLGWNPRRAARSVGDALDVGRHRSLLIARTEVLRTYRESSRAAWQSSRVVEGWVWVAALDRRTCAACWAMHGTLHRVDEAMGTHPACRCVQVPKTADWARVDPALGGAPETSIRVEAGPDVFRRLPGDDQRRVLGAKWEAWRDGRIDLADVVRATSHPVFGAGLREGSVRWALDEARRRALGLAAPRTYA